jgi:hypothetical protein
VSPFLTALVIAPMNASIASPVAALLAPVAAATASTSSCLFIVDPLFSLWKPSPYPIAARSRNDKQRVILFATR